MLGDDGEGEEGVELETDEGDLVVLTAAVLEEAAPRVPEGATFKAMYPYRLWPWLPQSSLGYPGHGVSHLLVLS